MLKKFQDMGKLLKQAQEMKAAMKKVQEELKVTKIPVSVKGDKIKVTLNGELDVLEVVIDPSMLSAQHANDLQSGVKEAFNEAIRKAKDLATAKLSKISGGLVPGQ